MGGGTTRLRTWPRRERGFLFAGVDGDQCAVSHLPAPLQRRGLLLIAWDSSSGINADRLCIRGPGTHPRVGPATTKGGVHVYVHHAFQLHRPRDPEY